MDCARSRCRTETELVASYEEKDDSLGLAVPLVSVEDEEGVKGRPEGTV